jgi:hypothetical protein
MRTLVFQGHSDDLFCMEGERRGEPDEMGCFGGAAAARIATAEGVGLIVVGTYSMARLPRTGGWIIGLSQLDEDVPLPDWPMRWRTAENGYSPRLEIDVPDAAVVERVGEE